MVIGGRLRREMSSGTAMYHGVFWVWRENEAGRHTGMHWEGEAGVSDAETTIMAFHITFSYNRIKLRIFGSDEKATLFSE